MLSFCSQRNVGSEEGIQAVLYGTGTAHLRGSTCVLGDIRTVCIGGGRGDVFGGYCPRPRGAT